MKRLLLLLAVLLASVATWAANEFNQGNLRYKFDAPYLYVIGYSTEVTPTSINNLVIPGYVKNSSLPRGATNVYSVSGLGNNASLQSVRIQYGVERIESNAFFGCAGLKKVWIPSSVTFMGGGAFAQISYLEDVYFAGTTPPSTGSGAVVFNGQLQKFNLHIPYGASSLTFKNGVFSSNAKATTSNMAYDFVSGHSYYRVTDSSNKKAVVVRRYSNVMTDPTSMTMWSIPDKATIDTGSGDEYTVVGVADNAAEDDASKTNLMQLLIGAKSLTKIGNSAFKGIPTLLTVSVTHADAIEAYAFADCPILQNVMLDDVGEIKNNVFQNCTSMTTIAFGAKIQAVNGGAFEGTNLVSFVVDANNPYLSALNGWLYNKSQTKLLRCPPLSTNESWSDNITAIGDNAFGGTKIEDIYIPYGVTEIGVEAFKNSSVKNVRIPSSVTKFDTRWAFSGCSSLSYVVCNMKTMPSTWTNTFENSRVKNARLYVHNGLVDAYKNDDGWKQFWFIENRAYDISTYMNEDYTVLSDNTVEMTDVGGNGGIIPATITYRSKQYRVTAIGDSAALDRSVVTSVSGPEVIKVGIMAFHGCTALKTVDLPALQKIEQLAFDGCTNLETIDMPEKMTSIGDGAFQGCKSLKSIRWPLGVYNVPQYVLNNCSSLTSFEVPYGVAAIGYCALKDCSSLKRVVLPSTVSYLESHCLDGCGNLQEIVMNREEPPTLRNGVFGVTTTLKSLTTDAYLRVPVSSVQRYKNNLLYGGGSSITNGMFKWARITAGGYDFLGSDLLALRVRQLPADDNAGTALVVFKTPDENASNTVIDLTKTVKDAWNREFRVIGLTDSCFAGTSAKTIILPEALQRIPRKCFDGAKNITGWNDVKVTAVTEIDDYAFANCSKFAPASLPESVTTLGEGVFMASGLKSMYLTSKLTSVGSYLFKNCTSLDQVRLTPALKFLPDGMFEGCTSLKQVHIPWGVKSLGTALFANCSALQEVTIPSSVNYTRYYAEKVDDGRGMFLNCSGLQKVVINMRTPKKMSADYRTLFDANGNMTNAALYVPRGYAQSYKDCEFFKKVKSGSIIEGAYDHSRKIYGTTIEEKYDVTVYSEEAKSGSLKLTSISHGKDEAFDVDCTVNHTDEWGRDFTVTEIADSAFYTPDNYGYNKIKSITTGYVNTIGKSAFREVSMTDDSENIKIIPLVGALNVGDYAFANMKKVKGIEIEGTAFTDFAANVILGYRAIGYTESGVMTDVYVPKDQFGEYVEKVALWDQPENLGRYINQLCCIYRPKSTTAESVIEKFPCSVELWSQGLKGNVLVMESDGKVVEHVVSAVGGNISVVLTPTPNSGGWKNRYLLPRPATTPVINGTPMPIPEIPEEGAPRSASQSGYDVYVYDETKKEFVKYDENSQEVTKGYYVEIPSGYDEVFKPTEKDYTGINDVEVRQPSISGKVYNLNGQKVDRPAKKGLYIIDGRKVMVK